MNLRRSSAVPPLSIDRLTEPHRIDGAASETGQRTNRKENADDPAESLSLRTRHFESGDPDVDSFGAASTSSVVSRSLEHRSLHEMQAAPQAQPFVQQSPSEVCQPGHKSQAQRKLLTKTRRATSSRLIVIGQTPNLELDCSIRCARSSTSSSRAWASRTLA